MVSYGADTTQVVSNSVLCLICIGLVLMIMCVKMHLGTFLDCFNRAGVMASCRVILIMHIIFLLLYLQVLCSYAIEF
jgi:hypothetical protein